MSNPSHDLWTAVDNLATLWSQTPEVAAMAAELPANAPHKAGNNAATVTSRLQGMKAGAASLFTRPLHLADVVTSLRDHPVFRFGADSIVDDDTLNEWLTHARNVQEAHRAAHAWLRAQMPGYPMLRIPYLGPNTHLTIEGPYGGHPWDPGVLRLGLQLQPAPPIGTRLLGSTPREQVKLNNALNRLAQTLKASAEWVSLADARARLTPADREALTAARTALQQDVDELIATQPNMLQADAALRHLARETTAGLQPDVRAYCGAFDAANELLDLAACQVFGQLTAYGTPQSVTPTKIDLPTPGTVHLEAHDMWRLDAGAIIHVNDPLLPNALQVHGITIRLDNLDLRPSTITAKVLDGTSIWFEGN